MIEGGRICKVDQNGGREGGKEEGWGRERGRGGITNSTAKERIQRASQEEKR